MQSPREEIRLGAGQTFRLLRWSRSVSRVELVVSPGRGVPLHGQGDHWHYHPETELTLIQEGTGTRFVGDYIELFESGDLVLIGGNVPHYWHMRGVSAGLSIQWDFPLDHGIWSFKEAAPLRALADSARRGLHLQGATAKAVRCLMEEFAALADLPRFAAFWRLLSVLADAPPRDVRPLAAQPFCLGGTAEQQESVRRAVSYVLANYRERVGLSELLRLTGMSRATFARQFRRHAGKSFSMFLNQVRLQAVCRSLRDTAEPISRIALGHGFNQLSFFNRLFRREFGISPGAYRAARRACRRSDGPRSGAKNSEARPRRRPESRRCASP